MPTSIPQDLDQLRDECGRSLVNYPTHRYAVTRIIDRLKDIWGEQGIPVDLADRIHRALSPHFDDLRGAVTQVGKEKAVDDLVEAYERLGLD